MAPAHDSQGVNPICSDLKCGLNHHQIQPNNFMTTEAIITQPVAELLDRIARRERLENEEWARVIEEAGTEDLRRLADGLRREFHPDDVVTYVVDRNINYSNICFSVCNFC